MKSAKGILRISNGLLAISGLAVAYVGYTHGLSSETLIWIVPIAVMVIHSIRLLKIEMDEQSIDREKRHSLSQQHEHEHEKA